MNIKQEENTPIGDYFHDSGVWTVFNALASTVDDFDVDTEQLNAWCESIVKSLKGLQGIIKKCETQYAKHLQMQKIEDMKKRGAE